MKETATVDALVLDCSPSGESFLKLFWISEASADYALLRETKRRTTSRPAPPQLLEIVIETPSVGGAQFVRDWRILRDWTELARHYDQFTAWGNIVRFLRLNLSHLSDYRPAFSLLLTVLDSLAAGKPAAATELKTLFQFARLEGYPVREEWLASLGKQRRLLADTVLYSPLDVVDLPSSDETSGLIASLKHYLTQVSHLNGDSGNEKSNPRSTPGQ